MSVNKSAFGLSLTFTFGPMNLVQLSIPPNLIVPEEAIALGIVTSAIAFFELPIWGALAVAEVWIALIVLMFVVANSRRVYVDLDSRCLIIQRRNIVLTVRRKEIPLSRFDCVLSYYPTWGLHNVICLMEHGGDRGVHIAEFEFTPERRPFWVPAPPAVECAGAKELRAKLCTMLGLRDAGFLDKRWPPKESK